MAKGKRSHVRRQTIGRVPLFADIEDLLKSASSEIELAVSDVELDPDKHQVLGDAPELVMRLEHIRITQTLKRNKQLGVLEEATQAVENLIAQLPNDPLYSEIRDFGNSDEMLLRMSVADRARVEFERLESLIVAIEAVLQHTIGELFSRHRGKQFLVTKLSKVAYVKEVIPVLSPETSDQRFGARPPETGHYFPASPHPAFAFPDSSKPGGGRTNC